MSNKFELDVIEIDEFNSIKEIIEKNEDTEIQAVINAGNTAISLSSSEKCTSIYIRKFLKRYTIANVSFENKRQGTLTKILEELKILSAKNGFNEIQIENVLTKEMSNFCKKHGFEKQENPYMPVDDIYGNYILHL